MNNDPYISKASAYLSTLCGVKPNRRTGSSGNREAVQFFYETIRPFGNDVDVTSFDSLDYRRGPAGLDYGGKIFQIHVSPYSPGCDLVAELAVVSSLEELAAVSCTGKILLMKGEICSEQLMPKNFPFYNPEHHQKVYALLEEKQPAGIVTATVRKPDQVGAIYPFPLIADGDFDIPNGYCTDAVGAEIEALAGKSCRLSLTSRRIPSSAANVIARTNPQALQKIVVTAHIDAYEDTPGALDNASGTVVLLLLAEMLSGYSGEMGIEIAAFNGEDHYSAGGQKDYLTRYGNGMGSITLGINIDGVGYLEGKSAFSFYECPTALLQQTEACFNDFPGLGRGDPWYSGDHMIFLQAGVPCLAFTSEKAFDLLMSVIHTQEDTPDIVDPVKLVEVAAALNCLIRSIRG